MIASVLVRSSRQRAPALALAMLITAASNCLAGDDSYGNAVDPALAAARVQITSPSANVVTPRAADAFFSAQPVAPTVRPEPFARCPTALIGMFRNFG
jgi:hypothetical protein